MATVKFCPNCEKETPCQKKGKTKNNGQRWLCKECGRTFVEINEQQNSGNDAPITKTEIRLNGTTIATVETCLSQDEAKEVLKMYIPTTVSDVKTERDGDVLRYEFTVSLGTKG